MAQPYHVTSHLASLVSLFSPKLDNLIPNTKLRVPPLLAFCLHLAIPFPSFQPKHFSLQNLHSQTRLRVTVKGKCVWGGGSSSHKSGCHRQTRPVSAVICLTLSTDTATTMHYWLAHPCSSTALFPLGWTLGLERHQSLSLDV